jgi:dihydroneopterin aldolase
MDIVFIQGLQIDCVIGIYDWERKIRQTITLDIEMEFDISQAAQTDDINHTLDYKAVSKRLIEFVRASDFQLVETLAEQITQIILQEFFVNSVKLTLNKGKAVTNAQGVGVIIRRYRG